MKNVLEDFNTDEELIDSESPPGIPWCVRILISAIPFGISAVCVLYGVNYAADPVSYVSPAELGLDNIFLFSTACALVLLIPWGRLGLQPTKVAGIEFQQVVSGQASEHAESLGYVEGRLDKIEAKVHSLDEMAPMNEHFEEGALRELLSEFLEERSPKAFSPSKIQAWGSKQDGYSRLAEYDAHFVRSTLHQMVSEGALATAVSRRGNTLYRYLNGLSSYSGAAQKTESR